MELLKLSKCRLHLLALISEVLQLKERERSANEQLQYSIQKQKQREEEFSRKITELQAELGLSNEFRQKLERKVADLVMENDLLESKQKELKETISNLLQSKEGFVKIYEESFGEMKQAIEAKDRRIEILSEKVKSHLLLVEEIEKEANGIKKVLSDAECIVKEREEVVIGLKRKVEEITEYESLFIVKIKDLENKLKNDEHELKTKDKVILGLEAQLEAANISKDFQPRMNEISQMSRLNKANLQSTLSAKELLIQNLILEKKALHSEIAHLGFFMMKIRDSVSHMDEENRRAFSSVLEGQEKCAAIRENEANNSKDVQKHEDNSNHDTSGGDAVENTASQFSQNPSPSRPLEEENSTCS